MEELLNKLIEMGWYPFCDKNVKEIRIYSDMDIECIYGKRKSDFYYTSYRKLTSKESGLWQFVCKNNLIQTEHYGFIDNGERAKNVFYKIDTYDEEGDVIQTGDMEGDRFIHISEPEYRIIESALKDEGVLEDFLLQNIKVEGN